MKREFKFKAKRKDDNNWVYGYVVVSKNGITHIFNDVQPNETFGYWTEVRPETVCQYIGIKDRQGRKIYDHDVVKAQAPECEYLYDEFKVEWDDDCLQVLFYRKDIDTWYTYDEIRLEYGDELVVAGSVFDY